MLSKIDKRINSQEPLKIWFWSLIVVLVLSFFSYGYLVRGAIVNIVARQNTESELAVLNSKVLDLESEYIKDENIITLDLAHNLGFVAVSSQKFVGRDVKTPGLSLVTPGI